MIKTFKHAITNISQRDSDINLFSMDNEIFATQTNNTDEIIITTVFYKSKSKWK